MLKKLGKFELIEEIGRGAMGEVYKAYDPSIGRLVALKTINGSLIGNRELLERFYMEARSSGTLHHPNIVTVYEFSREADTPYIAMEFLEGESLDKLIDRRPAMSFSQKVGMIVPVCRALDYAHKRGIVHRDVKPGNVMLSKDSNVKVVDFGIARLMDASKTQTNVIIGTLCYMSPQQISGARADAQGDIWALGVMFYELLCYCRPFDGENQASIMLNIVDESKHPVPVRQLVPECSPEVEALVDKMLQKDIGQRFQSMEEVLFEIEPVWEKLQEVSASGLIAAGEELIQSNDFSRARDLFRQALQIDSRSDRAKTLLEYVNAEIKRSKLRAQVKNVLAKAHTLLNEGHFHEARAEIQSALKLDSGSSEAKELLSDVQRAFERVRLVQEGLQAAKRCLADGALSQAAQEIRAVLELDCNDTQARELQEQIQDQIIRRDERKRLASVLQNARRCWAEQRLDDCITLLIDAQSQFPADADIVQLLEAVIQDRTEQKKQQAIAEVRRLLAGQRVEEALAIVEPVYQQQPNDEAIRKIREMVLQDRNELLRQQEFKKELAGLQSLVGAQKFSDVISRGEKLLREFPQEHGLTELVSFARAEVAQLERKQLFEESLEGVRRKIEASEFRDAVASAEKALSVFPCNSDLETLLEQAQSKLKEKENRDLMHQRIGEIRKKIRGNENTDAVDLARQTIATLGQDTDVNQLLRVAEMELAQKREKERHATKGDVGKFSPQIDKRSTAIPPKIALSSAPVEELAPGCEPATTRVQKGSVLSQTGVQNESLAANRVMESFTATVAIGPGAVAPDLAGVPSPMENTWRSSDAEVQTELAHRAADAAAFFRSAWNRRGWPRLLAISAVTVIVLIVGVSYFMLRGRGTRAEEALRDRGQQLEEKRNWSGALEAYQDLARRHGKLAKVGLERATRLTRVIDQENSLLATAQADETAGDTSNARKLYEQAADLHGEKEQEARNDLARLTGQIIPPPVQPNPPAFSRPTIERPGLARSGRAPISVPLAANPPSQNCQLLSTELPTYLDMADTNRARGKYVDAKREYGAVLECDSKNERARDGLTKTKEAEAVATFPSSR